MNYDSKTDTLLHIKRVAELLTVSASELLRRATCHDESKLIAPEKPLFDEMTPLLKDSTYGSEEYRNMLARLKPALDHHYAHNSHHPEHYPNGVNDMDLFDLIEMFLDWKAAGERHANGSMDQSLEVNKGRFALADQLVAIFRNTNERFFNT